MEIPASLAVVAFDGIIERGQIIHFVCTFVDQKGQPFQKNKFAVVLNATLPDDPILYALTTSQVDLYSRTTMFDHSIIRMPAGTYQFFAKDTVLSFREVRQVDLDELRKQYSEKRLTIVGRLHKVHEDQMNTIITSSLLIERWKVKRCSPPAPAPPTETK